MVEGNVVWPVIKAERAEFIVVHYEASNGFHQSQASCDYL